MAAMRCVSAGEVTGDPAIAKTGPTQTEPQPLGCDWYRNVWLFILGINLLFGLRDCGPVFSRAGAWK